MWYKHANNGALTILARYDLENNTRYINKAKRVVKKGFNCGVNRCSIQYNKLKIHNNIAKFKLNL